MESPKVSIITVVYNDETRILKTLQSVSQQSYSNLEYIIIDGLSSDNTLNVINTSKIKVDKLISEKDKGIYDAMNKGVVLSTGDWVLFLNAGDTFYTESTLREIFNFDDSNSFDIIYGKHMWDYETFKKESYERPLNIMYKTMPFCHQAALAKRKLLTEFPFDLNYKIIADYDFFRKVYYNKAKFIFRPVIFVNYLCTGGVSSSNMVKLFWENLKITSDLNIFYRYYLFAKKVVIYKITQLVKIILPLTIINKFKKTLR